MVRQLVDAFGCWESDGGAVKEIRGNTYYYLKNLRTNKKELNKSTDDCVDEITVREYDCSKLRGMTPKSSNNLMLTMRCDEGQVCQNGACVPDPCFDTDMGLNFTTFGTVVINTADGRTEVPDTCVSESILNEGMCNEFDTYVEQRINCCDYGMLCNIDNGRCDFPAAGQENRCRELADLCPEVEGIQEEYLFDRDGDGEKESCVPVEEIVCSEPNPGQAYPNATVYSHEGNLHLGFCIDGEASKVMHVICSDNNEWSADVTDCMEGNIMWPCRNGECMSCIDSDVDAAHPDGINWEVAGYVIELDVGGHLVTSNDFCMGNEKYEHFCNGNRSEHRWAVCPQGQICRQYTDENGHEVIGCTGNCIKVGDPNNDINVAGVIYDLNNQSFPDFCEGRTLRQFSCDPATGAKVDIPAFECPNGCDAGACLR